MKLFSFILILTFSISVVKAQFIEISKVKINDTFELYPSVEEFRKAGLVTKTEPIPEDYDIQNFDSVFYAGKTRFEYVKGDSTLSLSVLRFDNVITSITVDSQKLTEESTPTDVAKILDGRCQTLSKLDVYKEGKYDTCSIPLGEDIMYDLMLLFFFREGKLVRIDLWEPT